LRFGGERQAGELVGRLDFREDDDVGAHLADEREVVGGAAVHADPDGGSTPVVVAQGAGYELAGRVLPPGSDGVLEVENYLVGWNRRRLRELARVVPRNGQAGAATANDHVPTLTISVPARNESRILPMNDLAMRYLAASIGLLGTLVLIAPFH